MLFCSKFCGHYVFFYLFIFISILILSFVFILIFLFILPFLFIFCYQSQLRKSTASVSSIASGPKDPSNDVRMALHKSQEVLAMAAAAAAKGPVALPQKDVCISSVFLICPAFIFCFVLFLLYQTQVRTPTSLRRPCPQSSTKF